MKIHLHASVFFENWNWTNAETGIGGSETHQIEMAWRLARRGFEVISYAPLPEDSPREHLGVRWEMWDKANFHDDGIWVMYRYPEALDAFEPGQRVWFMAQDEHYGQRLTPERAAKVEKFLVLSPWHAIIFGTVYPFIPKDKLVLTSNGIKVDLIRKLESQTTLPRNPKKVVFTSSPDRGLETAIAIFRRAREWVPDLEFHSYYGFDNMNKLIALNNKYGHYRIMRDRILKSVEGVKGITLHGRIPQPELYAELATAGVWLYPTEFGETSCINCMEAQALGAIPLTNPYAALEANVHHGITIMGWPYKDFLTQCRYVGELVKLAENPDLQEEIRAEMIPESRARFNWERWVDQWANWIENRPQWHTQFQFQGRYMQGRTLNIGCGDDPMGFAKYGATNMDIAMHGPVGNVVNRPHLLHDARKPFEHLSGHFDSIIIGDMLEHMSEEDAIQVLMNAKAALKNGGPIIITCPNDSGRPHTEQHKEATGDETYTEGVTAFHDRKIEREDLERMIKAAGLKVYIYQPIDYGQFEGHGIVCAPDYSN